MIECLTERLSGIVVLYQNTFKPYAFSNVKLSNYVIAKRVGLVVKRKEETLNEEAMTVANERRAISVAVTRKKKTAVDAIRNVAEGKFG